MTGGNGVSDLHTFLAQHKLQLEGAGVPSIYWDCLHTKLSKQIFDAGEQFTLLQVFVGIVEPFLYSDEGLLRLRMRMVTWTGGRRLSRTWRLMTQARSSLWITPGHSGLTRLGSN